MDKITIEKCCCGSPACQTYWLKGIGHFCQGSGFEKYEAERIVRALNSEGSPKVDNDRYYAAVDEAIARIKGSMCLTTRTRNGEETTGISGTISPEDLQTFITLAYLRKPEPISLEDVCQKMWERDYPNGGSLYKHYRDTQYQDKEWYRREVKFILNAAGVAYVG